MSNSLRYFLFFIFICENTDQLCWRAINPMQLTVNCEAPGDVIHYTQSKLDFFIILIIYSLFHNSSLSIFFFLLLFVINTYIMLEAGSVSALKYSENLLITNSEIRNI